MIEEVASSKGLNALPRNTTCHATFVFHHALREQLVVTTLKRSYPMNEEFISFHSLPGMKSKIDRLGDDQRFISESNGIHIQVESAVVVTKKTKNKTR